jgi:hypothetical protein
MRSPTVVVSGMIAGTPRQGGATWAVLQYLLGLRRLGYDVLFVEPVEGDDVASSEQARYCHEVMRRFGLDGRWALVQPGRLDTIGISRAELRATARRADLLLNVSGMLTDADVLEPVATRVYLDLDPAFVQLWHDVEHIDMRLDAHTHFVTIADTIGTPASPIPACGRTWIPTLPPVVLPEWPVGGHLEHDALTTVAHWRGYGSIEHNGLSYGQKAHALRPLIDLPMQTVETFRLALSIHPDEKSDLAALGEHRWELVDPAVVAATPDDYRRFVAGSKGEFGVAKSGYVVSNSGWFSDRSACYLASARPVIAHDTGFARRLPTGKGLFAFADAGDVAAAVEAIRTDYAGHRAAARAIAEEHLDSDRVLRALLDRVTA